MIDNILKLKKFVTYYNNLFILRRKKANMYYYPQFHFTQSQIQLPSPINIFIPQLYPYIIDTSFSSKVFNLPPIEIQPLKEPISSPIFKRISKMKKSKACSEKNKIQKFQKKTRTSLPQKQKKMIDREFAMEVDAEGRLNVKIEWRNQNRNIIPNIMNQLLSFLTKKFKSEKIIEIIFKKDATQPSWTPKRYYNYIKIIKEKTSHYLDESDLRKFFAILRPQCEIYSQEQQEFYMKICRMLIVYFLKNEVILIASTSTRMNEYNRKIHLLGRDILLKIFSQTVAEFKLK